MQYEHLLIVNTLLMVLVASLTDLATRRIPNSLLLIFFLSALVIRVQWQGIEFTFEALLQMLAVTFILMPFFHFRWICGGDIKLYLVLAFSLTRETFLEVFLLSMIAGALMAIAYLMVHWLRSIITRPLIQIDGLGKHQIPYAGAIATGVIASLWLNGSLTSLTHV